MSYMWKPDEVNHDGIDSNERVRGEKGEGLCASSSEWDRPFLGAVSILNESSVWRVLPTLGRTAVPSG